MNSVNTIKSFLIQLFLTTKDFVIKNPHVVKISLGLFSLLAATPIIYYTAKKFSKATSKKHIKLSIEKTSSVSFSLTKKNESSTSHQSKSSHHTKTPSATTENNSTTKKNDEEKEHQTKSASIKKNDEEKEHQTKSASIKSQEESVETPIDPNADEVTLQDVKLACMKRIQSGNAQEGLDLIDRTTKFHSSDRLQLYIEFTENLIQREQLDLPLEILKHQLQNKPLAKNSLYIKLISKQISLKHTQEAYDLVTSSEYRKMTHKISDQEIDMLFDQLFESFSEKEAETTKLIKVALLSKSSQLTLLTKVTDFFIDAGKADIAIEIPSNTAYNIPGDIRDNLIKAVIRKFIKTENNLDNWAGIPFFIDKIKGNLTKYEAYKTLCKGYAKKGNREKALSIAQTKIRNQQVYQEIESEINSISPSQEKV